jgi:hypothetical protein
VAKDSKIAAAARSRWLKGAKQGKAGAQEAALRSGIRKCGPNERPRDAGSSKGGPAGRGIQFGAADHDPPPGPRLSAARDIGNESGTAARGKEPKE